MKYNDEIVKRCWNCEQHDVKVAYWDFELEGYLFLRDAAVCQTCLDKTRKLTVLSEKLTFDQAE